MPANEAKPTGPTAWGSGDSWTQEAQHVSFPAEAILCIPNPSILPVLFLVTITELGGGKSGGPMTAGKWCECTVEGQDRDLSSTSPDSRSPHTCIPKALARQAVSQSLVSALPSQALFVKTHAQAASQAGTLEMRRDCSTRHDMAAWVESKHPHAYTLTHTQIHKQSDEGSAASVESRGCDARWNICSASRGTE